MKAGTEGVFQQAEVFCEVELPLYGFLRSSPLARLSGIMLATVRDELRSRVGQQGGWRHDEDGVNSGLDSAGRGVLRHPPDPTRISDPDRGVLEVRHDAAPVLGHPDRVVLVRHG